MSMFAGMDVLAVVVGDVASSSLQFSVPQIWAATRKEKMEQTQVTKDFLILEAQNEEVTV